MPQRQKILLGLLAAMAVLLLGGKTVYPRWIQPLFDVSKEIAIVEADLNILDAKWERYRTTREEYKQYVVRSGGTDAKEVKNDLQARLNRLISECDLSSKGITPQSPKQNRKTHLQEFRFDIRAEGKLESVVSFLASCEKLPQVVRLAEIRLNPASTGRRGQTEDRIALFCRLEVVVPSAVDGTMMVKVGPDDQPTEWDRHAGDVHTYASIWNAQPFTEWQAPPPPPPPPVETKPPPVREVVEAPLESEPKTRREDKGTLVDLVAIYGDGQHKVREVHTRNKRGNDRGQYRSPGDDMDGGKLVMVHPLGAVVRREGEDYFYPRGLTFGDSIRLAKADDYPEVVAQMRLLKKLEASEREQDEDGESDAANVKRPSREADVSGRVGRDSAANGDGRSDRGKTAGKSGSTDRATSGSGKRASKTSVRIKRGSTSGPQPLSIGQRVREKTDEKSNDDDTVKKSDDGDGKGDNGDKPKSPKRKKKTKESDADKKEAKDADDSDDAKDDN